MQTPLKICCTLSSLLLIGCSTIINIERSATGFSGILLSNVKSPVIYKLHDSSGFGSPLAPSVYRQLLEAQPVDCDSAPFEDDQTFDRFHEFQCSDDSADTLVVISISGGGSRAAIFAAHVMALLEHKYDELRGCDASRDKRPPGTVGVCDEQSLGRRIHAFSTVSGGSLFAFYVARQLRDEQWMPSSGLFKRVLSYRCDGLAKLGRWSFFSYLRGSSVVKIGPISWLTDFFTDTSYRSYLERGLEFGGYFEPLKIHKWPSRVASGQNPLARRRMRFGDWAKQGKLPRLYFNATMLESGAPFVFTQRITNLRPAEIPHRTARPDLPNVGCDANDRGEPCARASECLKQARRRPLRHSLTPEDFGNSPAAMAVSDAAVASAAFPFAVDPVTLRRFALRTNGQVVGTDDFVSLADGGVFDNSGLTTAVDLYDYLQQHRRVEHLILIVINADSERYHEDLAEQATTIEGPPKIGVGIPLPTLFSGADSLNLIHYSNKRRAELLAWKRLAEIVSRKYPDIERAAQSLSAELPAELGRTQVSPVLDALQALRPESRKQLEAMIAQPGVSPVTVVDAYRRERASKYVHYFPVDLSQLSSADPHAIPGGQSEFDKASRLATTFWTYAGDDFVLEEAAKRIVRSEQQTPWPVGPTCCPDVRRLDEAVAYALLRSSSSRWDDNSPAVEAICPAHP